MSTIAAIQHVTEHSKGFALVGFIICTYALIKICDLAGQAIAWGMSLF